jgi:hypothetical protein
MVARHPRAPRDVASKAGRLQAAFEPHDDFVIFAPFVVSPGNQTGAFATTR